jgi:hypothetical protein
MWAEPLRLHWVNLSILLACQAYKLQKSALFGLGVDLNETRIRHLAVANQKVLTHLLPLDLIMFGS